MSETEAQSGGAPVGHALISAERAKALGRKQASRRTAANPRPNGLYRTYYVCRDPRIGSRAHKVPSCLALGRKPTAR